MKRKKLVSVNSYDIFPMNNGGKLSVFGLCRGLSEYFDVTLIMVCGSDAQFYKKKIRISENFTIMPVFLSQGGWKNSAAEATKRGWPNLLTIMLEIVWPKETDFLFQLRNAAGDADIILIDHPYTYSVMKAAVPDKLYWHRANNVETEFMKSVLAQYDAHEDLLGIIADIEGKCCRGCHHIFTVTERDKENLCKIYNLSNENVTNTGVGWDIDTTEFVLPSTRADDSILFLSGNYPAAVAAALRIVAAAREVPDYKFYIGGMVCDNDALRQDVPRNVCLLGVVPDYRKSELLKNCALALNPVLSGAGINMKLIEDFAFGIPVLTTQHGIRGINAKHGEEVFIEDGTNLAEAIQNFFAYDFALRDRVARNARAMVEREWTWGHVANKMIVGAGMALPPRIPQKVLPYDQEITPNLQNKEIFMWGAGRQAMACLKEIARRTASKVRIVDSDTEKIGTAFNNIVIESPEALFQASDAVCVISVLSVRHIEEIIDDCRAHGMDKENLIIVRGDKFNPAYFDLDRCF